MLVDVWHPLLCTNVDKHMTNSNAKMNDENKLRSLIKTVAQRNLLRTAE
jgi:hypothetical protein